MGEMTPMKKLILLPAILMALISCSPDDEADDNDESPVDPKYKQAMRDFVIGIGEYAKAAHSDFYVIPQNGVELVTANGEEDGSPNAAYLSAIDGNGQEDLFYGYDYDDQPTPSEDNLYLRAFLNISRNAGNVILVTDYCSTKANVDNSYSVNHASNYVSFAADQRDLNNIPAYPAPIYAENNSAVIALTDVKNFLYLINPEHYSTKSDFINAVTATNYDLLIMDLFFTDGAEFTSPEINQLRNKANGGKRLIIAYMSIGEAEDYRYYWQPAWNTTKPSWMDAENPDWPGNFKVKYWDSEWQAIIYGNDSSYLKKILNAGFDGVYLDIIDAFEYYE